MRDPAIAPTRYHSIPNAQVGTVCVICDEIAAITVPSGAAKAAKQGGHGGNERAVSPFGCAGR
jgi:hypothetical protein